MAGVRARLLGLALRHTVKRRLERLPPLDLAAVRASRRRLDAMAARMAPPEATVEAFDADGVGGLVLTPPNAEPGRAVLHLHGGGYVVGSPQVYRDLAARLGRAAAAAVYLPDYRLAPEHRFPAALDDARRTWHWLLRRVAAARSVAVSGDSAGGGLALALQLSLRDRDEPLPGAGVLMSPWTDLTGSGASVVENARRDCLLVAERMPEVVTLYLGDHDRRDPLASPLLADLGRLPPQLVHASRDEILRDDATRLAARARAAGTSVELTLHGGLPHAFHLFAPLIPEARTAIEALGAFARRHTR
ncbi:MAG: alpha/beta hydrolase [Ectothiorhodospiraceae bacterium]|nr:alpha/beta hydrolase [Chromatiales bacterium]MCP5156985.1 alpha/beta hydrolase [Ectothiorhodospiraceae bacterium]